MKRFITFTLLIIASYTLEAQVFIFSPKKNFDGPAITLYGRIINNFTHAALDSAFVTIMTPDSTVVDTMTCKIRDLGRGTSRLNYYFLVPRKKANYILKTEAEGYETAYTNYEIKYLARNQDFEIPDILMQKHYAYDKTLDEVEVVATKVQMVFKGDTIVYNADAFNVPEGSMLDALIRQMPGVELNEDGEIKVNGRKIDKLTLNGDDFMQGNNNNLLKNLPYYTVKEVQVYNKTAEQDEGRDIQTQPKDFVMDVRLKKEYNRGLMGNAEIGAGTHSRYMSRIFGMMFTDLTKVSVFGNLNNVNENRHPGEEGDWDARKEPQGIRNFKNIGTNINMKARDDRLRDNISADISWNKAEDESRYASTNYMDKTNNFSRRQATSMAHNTNFNFTNRLTSLKKIRTFNTTTIGVSDGDNSSLNRSALFLDDPQKYGSTLAILDSIFAQNPHISSSAINRNLNRGFGKTKSFLFSNMYNASTKLPWGDYLEWGFIGKYDSNDSKSFDLMQIDYFQNGLPSDFRNQYQLNKGHNYVYRGDVGYRISFANNLQWNVTYYYQQTYKHLENPLYRLDYIDGWGYMEGTDYSSIDWNQGILPPQQQLSTAIEPSNSVFSGLWSKSHQILNGLIYPMNGKKWSGFSSLNIAVEHVNDKLHYERGSINVNNNRHYWAPAISLYSIMQTTDQKNTFSLEASRRVNPSDVVSMVGYVDDTNPLAIKMGNPELKNGATDRIHLYISKRSGKSQTSGSVYLTFTYYENAITQGYSYNKEKGAYTYKPMNVNGNNEVNTGFHLSTALDKKKLFTFNNHTDLSFRRYVQMALLSGATEASVFGIHGAQVSQRNDVSYRKGDLTLTLGGEFFLKHNESRLETFKNNNLRQFNYGITAKYKLPLDIHIATDVKMSNIRGMEDKSMNINQVVWNGKLSRSFCKGKLTTILEGFDILGKLKDIQYYVNSDGATSYWVRSIPSYVMLHLQYKINIQPKKK